MVRDEPMRIRNFDVAPFTAKWRWTLELYAGSDGVLQLERVRLYVKLYVRQNVSFNKEKRIVTPSP